MTHTIYTSISRTNRVAIGIIDLGVSRGKFLTTPTIVTRGQSHNGSIGIGANIAAVAGRLILPGAFVAKGFRGRVATAVRLPSAVDSWLRVLLRGCNLNHGDGGCEEE